MLSEFADSEEEDAFLRTVPLPSPVAAVLHSAAREKPTGDDEGADQKLREALTELHALLQSGQGGGKPVFDTSDCGAAKKRRRLTAQQRDWARGGGGTIGGDSGSSDELEAAAGLS